ncbi:hypothetical protein ES703_38104 [subsurface metagenome]
MLNIFLKKSPIIVLQAVLKNLILMGSRLLKEDGMFFAFRLQANSEQSEKYQQQAYRRSTTATSYYVANNSVFSLFSKTNRRTIRDRVGILGSNTDSRK